MKDDSPFFYSFSEGKFDVHSKMILFFSKPTFQMSADRVHVLVHVH